MSRPDDLMLRLEHVGIATTDAKAVASVFRALFGRAPYADEIVTEESVRTTFLEAGPVKIELLESLDAQSALGRYLERYGPGLHHLAFEVPDLDAAHARLAAAGFRLLGDPRTGADEKRIFFVHPRDAGGILVECCAGARGFAGPLEGTGPDGAPAVLVLGGPAERSVARAIARRLKVWYTPDGPPPAGLPAGHHLVVFGDRVPSTLPEAASAFRIALVDPPPDRLPHDRADLLVVVRSRRTTPATAGPVVHLPDSILRRLPDPVTTLADVITAHLTA